MPLIGTVASSFFQPSNAGYFAGGYGTDFIARVDKFNFDLETLSTLGTGLTSANSLPTGFSNSGIAGYVAGGDATSPVSTVQKFAFPADTRTTLATGLSAVTSGGGSGGNKGVAGYVAFGDQTQTVNKIAFSNDSRSILATGLSENRSRTAGFVNNASAFYTGGMLSASTVIDKFATSNDSRSTLANGLSVGRWNPEGASNQGVAGFICGGQNGVSPNAISNVIDKITYSNDTSSAFTTSTFEGPGACSYDGVALYNAGGYDGSAPRVNTIRKIPYSTQVTSTITATLSANTAGMASWEHND